MKKYIRVWLCVICVLEITQIKVYPLVEDILLGEIILNQMLEIGYMYEEIQSQIERYAQLGNSVMNLPLEVLEEIEERKRDLNNISQLLLDDFQNIYQTLENNIVNNYGQVMLMLEQAKQVLQSSKQAFLARSLDLEQSALEQVRQLEKEIRSNASTIAQQQITNYTLNTMVTQLQSMLEILLTSQKIQYVEDTANKIQEEVLEQEIKSITNKFWGINSGQ